MPGPSETESAPAATTLDDVPAPLDDEQVETHSLDDAQDEALARVIQQDAQHPPHDDVPTATRDEAPPARRHGVE